MVTADDAISIYKLLAANGAPAWDEAGDFVFSKRDLSGMGRIAGQAVEFITPESQVMCHDEYELPESQVRDVELLAEKFGVDYPDAISRDDHTPNPAQG